MQIADFCFLLLHTNTHTHTLPLMRLSKVSPCSVLKIEVVGQCSPTRYHHAPIDDVIASVMSIYILVSRQSQHGYSFYPRGGEELSYYILVMVVRGHIYDKGYHLMLSVL